MAPHPRPRHPQPARAPGPGAATGPGAQSGAFARFAAALLPGLPPPDRPRLRALARTVRAGHGEAVIADSAQDRIVFVARGATKLVAHASHGREQIVAFHFAGDLIHVPARATHAYTLCALGECELVILPAAPFLALAREEAALAHAVLDRVLASLSRSREKAIALGRKTARERLAGFLVTMAARIGTPCGAICVLDLPMSRRDIADNLGLTIETVSRQLSELRAAGLVETAGRSVIRLIDRPALAARAGHLPDPA